MIITFKMPCNDGDKIVQGEVLKEEKSQKYGIRYVVKHNGKELYVPARL